MNAIENWADVDELIRSLLPPDSVLSLLGRVWRLTPEETVWLENLQAARVSLEKDKVAA